MPNSLTKEQADAIKRIIQEHMNVVSSLMVGGHISDSDIKRLGLPKNITDLITTAYQYGKLQTIQDKDLTKMSVQEVEKLMDDLRLTSQDKAAISSSQIRADQYVSNITQRLTTAVITAAVQSDLDMWSAVKEVVPDAVRNAKSRGQVAMELRDKTGDFTRDWNRVANTEMWNAKLQGEAHAIEEKHGPDAIVFKRPCPNACSVCRKLYLEKDGITPKLFKLSELKANGTNDGRKSGDWKPVLGTVHPNCRCVLNFMPEGTKFHVVDGKAYATKDDDDAKAFAESDKLFEKIKKFNNEQRDKRMRDVGRDVRSGIDSKVANEKAAKKYPFWYDIPDSKRPKL